MKSQTRLTILAAKAPIVSDILSKLRDVHTQGNRTLFRHNLRKIGQILAYEMSQQFDYIPKEITTPLAIHTAQVLENQPIVISIMRAGLPLQEGFLSVFDDADTGFIGAFREHTEGGANFDIALNYLAVPSLEGRDVVLLDPMIATGRSLKTSFEALKSHGTPRRIFIGGVIASAEGIDFVKKNFPDAHIFVGEIDAILNEKAYIVPGLGDAGDLAFGQK